MKHVKLYEEFSILGKKKKKDKKVEEKPAIPSPNQKTKSNQEILDHIYDIDRKGNRIYTYLHTTNEEVCKSVLKNGFEFYEFAKTVDEIADSIETFNYKLSMRAPYGKYTLVIQTLEPIVDGEDVTIKEPFVSEEGDLTYTLSPTHVRGYFNNQHGEFTENPNFKLS